MDKEQIKENMPERFTTTEEFWQNAYPADIAELLNNLETDEKKSVIDTLSLDELSEVVSDLDYGTSYFLAEYFSEEELSRLLIEMHPDDAVDFMGTMPINMVKYVLDNMKANKAAELQKLLGYDEESAGGLMTTDFIAFYSDNTVEEVLNKFHTLISEPEMIYYIYVISRTKELLGVLSVRQLLVSDRSKQLREIMSNNVINVKVDMDQEDVAHVLSKYDLLAVPVVNKKNKLMGIITVDDAIDVIENEATEDIYKMAAAGDTDYLKQGLLGAVKKRLPWLLILLVGDMLSGSVIQNFEASLHAVVALAFFIPVLMDMGGNVGTQSLTVVVRGLATNELDFSDFWSHLWKEIRVGFMMAAVLGLLLTMIVLFWQGNPTLGLIVGISMFSTLLSAIILGTSIPFILEALGADPAVAAGPFITTLVDISGLFIYFTMATLLMEKLI